MKAGTYVLDVKSMNDVDDETVDLTPVFIVVKKQKMFLILYKEIPSEALKMLLRVFLFT